MGLEAYWRTMEVHWGPTDAAYWRPMEACGGLFIEGLRRAIGGPQEPVGAYWDQNVPIEALEGPQGPI